MRPEFTPSDIVLKVFLKNITNGSTYCLKYRIYKNESSARWINILNKTLAFGAVIRDNGVFFGKAVVDAEKIARDLEANIDYHNSYCDRKGLKEHIPLKLDNPVTQERLSVLHTYFEKYAEDPRFCAENRMMNELKDLNLNIHRLESCLGPAESGHVELLNEPSIAVELKDNDYKLFTPDFRWGELYVTYGMTGVPTMNAFWAKSEPVPQHVLTNGMMLAFWPDHDFTERDQLKIFLESKGLSIDDPRSAIGFLPMGMLEDIETLDRAEILKNIKLHAHISHFCVEKEPYVQIKPQITAKPVIKDDSTLVISGDLPEAKWPWEKEVLYHLDLVPYIDLKVQFDAKKLYEEAEKALPYFVSHRDYDQETNSNSGKWKSLALRGLFGDYTKTQYHTSYTFEGKAEYRETVFAELCPETMKFLNTITDISQCERIRFMLLEPGAKIKCHRDSQDKDVSFAVNISLNMPDECKFYSSLNKDGSENPYTVVLPFKDSGSVLLFNNAKYHKVENNSDKPRIHIILHGPIRFNDEQLIKLARAQNDIPDLQELIRKLMYKKNFLGEELTKTSYLFNEWVMTGLRDNSIPDNYAVAIYDHDKYFDSHKASHHYLNIRTVPTFFPLSYDLLKENEWDTYLEKSFQSNKEFAVIVAAGTFFLNLHKFIEGLVIDSQRLKKDGYVAAGHLMDFKDKNLLPYFHEQFLIINLKAWNEIGKPSLGGIYGSSNDELKGAEISSEQIHDDYTPLWIKASKDHSDKPIRTGFASWGSKLIIEAVKHGRGVINLSNNIRDQKKYAYPRDNIAGPKKEIEEVVLSKLEHSKNEVFYFNNEPLSVLNIPNLEPNKIISVAAGFKPFQIISQYKATTKTEIMFLDFSVNALNYLRNIISTSDFNELAIKLKEIIKSDKTKSATAESVDSQLMSIVRSYFSGSTDDLMKAVKTAKTAKFSEANLVQDSETISRELSTGDRFVIWISNAFYNNSLFMLMTPEQADERLILQAKSISQKTNNKVYRYQQTHTFVFGKSLGEIRGILTDGGMKTADFSDKGWGEL